MKKDAAGRDERPAALRGEDMEENKRKNRRKRGWLIAAALLGLLAAAFAVWAAGYYRADDKALAALAPGGTVSVARTDYGWLFDGPGTDAALIFYPGARVEETAYAPLLRRLAEKGTDVCLLRAPLHLAFFDMDRAESVRREYDYARCYVGGHSLGGACAAICASRHPGDFAGVVLLAAYPTKTLDGDMTELTLYGTEDGVLDRARLEEGRQYAPDRSAELVIEGGNHAQFGSYGRQRGDGEAAIPPEEQWAQAADFIAAELDRAA